MQYPRPWIFRLFLIGSMVLSVLSPLSPGHSIVSAQDALRQTEKKVPVGSTNISGQRHIIASINYKMVYIPPGTFIMGSPPSERGRYEDEALRQVTLTKGFYIGITEITQGQWKKIMGNNPSHFKECGEDCPVEQIAWNGCLEFIRALNRKEKTRTYRLPTEAEWEYACRAGSSLAFANGDITQTNCDYDPNLDKIGWYCGNSGEKTQSVSKKIPNAWGLYDMHGNAWEWCQDWYEPYKPGPIVDPKGPASGMSRVFRGGGWGLSARTCRSAFRDKYDPNLKCRHLGFRLVREAEGQKPLY